MVIPKEPFGKTLIFSAKVRGNKMQNSISKVVTIPHGFCRMVGIAVGDHVAFRLVRIEKEGDEGLR